MEDHLSFWQNMALQLSMVGEKKIDMPADSSIDSDWKIVVESS